MSRYLTCAASYVAASLLPVLLSACGATPGESISASQSALNCSAPGQLGQQVQSNQDPNAPATHGAVQQGCVQSLPGSSNPTSSGPDCYGVDRNAPECQPARAAECGWELGACCGDGSCKNPDYACDGGHICEPKCGELGRACCGVANRGSCNSPDLQCSSPWNEPGSICNPVERVIPDGARTFRVVFWNQTTHFLQLVEQQAQSGDWAREPARMIAPNSYVEWAIQSGDGPFTKGAIGHVKYVIDDGPDEAVFSWDNPKVGANHVESSAPAGFVANSNDDGAADSGSNAHTHQAATFFFLREQTQPAHICNPYWVKHELSMQNQDALNAFDKAVGLISTEVGKESGISSWENTGCYARAGVEPVRDAQHSTDGVYTVDAEIKGITVGDNWATTPNAWLPLSFGEPGIPASIRFVRVEIEQGTAAHDYAEQHPINYRAQLSVSGPMYVDTDGPFMEIHPNEASVAGSVALGLHLSTGLHVSTGAHQLLLAAP